MRLKKLSKKLKNINISRNNRFIAIPFVVVFAGLAASLIPNLFAATSSVATEAESSTQTSNVSIVSDAGASGGSALVFGSAPTVIPASPISGIFPSPELLAYDMFGKPYRSDGTVKNGVSLGAPPWGKHELVPLRLNPTFDFYEGSRFGQSPSWEGRYISPWGQVFIAQGNTAREIRLQVRNSHVLYLGQDNIWRNVRGDVSKWKMEGAYLDTYFFGVGLTSSVRDESSNGGGWSVSLAPLVDNAKAASWHWWLNGFYPRSAIPAGTKAVFAAQEIRLITDGTSGDDPAADSTRFIASFSADAYASATTGTPPITPYMQPRMKRISEEWIWVTGHSFTAWWTSGFGPSNILANPPTSWPK